MNNNQRGGRRARARQRNRPRRGRNNGGNGAGQLALVRIPPRVPNNLALPRMTRTNIIWTSGGVLTSTGALGANTYLQLNYPNVPILSGADPAGKFVDLIALYPYYRALGAKIRFEFSNNEAFQVFAYGAPVLYGDSSLTVPAANDVTTATDFRGVQLYPGYRDRLLSPAGSMDRGSFTQRVNFDQMLVGKWAGIPDIWTGSYTTSAGNTAPTQKLYYLFGVYTVDGSTLTAGNGIAYRITSETDIVFFGQKVGPLGT